MSYNHVGTHPPIEDRVLMLSSQLPYTAGSVQRAIDTAILTGLTFEQAREIICETQRATGDGLNGLYSLLMILSGSRPYPKQGKR